MAKLHRLSLIAMVGLGCRSNPDYCAGSACNHPTDSARLDTSSSGSDGSGGGSDGSGQAGYRPTAVSFSRAAGNYLTMGPLSGAGSLSQQRGTFSVWLRFTANDGEAQDITLATNVQGLMAGITRTAGNQIQFNLPTCLDAPVLVMSTQNQYTIASGWIHVLAAWDVTSGSASIYVNDALDTGSGKTVNNADICYIAANWGVGGLTSAQLDADVADLYALLGTYIDITVPANRQKFINSNGKPADLGTSCASPDGAPIGCLHNPLATWNVDVGTGGGFTVNGPALTAAPTNPAD